jgi:glycosyltransferase involved in cell wall biosynthesis
MKIAIVAPKVNLETGGGSHLSLVLYGAGLQGLGCETEVYSLNAVSPGSRDEMMQAGLPLHDLGGLEPAEQAERLGRVKSDVLLFDANLPLAYHVKRRFPAQRVVAHLNTLSGFCTNLARQAAGCWLTCRHLDRVRHHPGPAAQRLRFAALGALRVADLARGFRSLDGWVFPSPQTADAYRLYGLDPDRCVVVPESLDLEHIGRFRAAAFGTSGGPVTVLYVGMLPEYKGMSLLFDALRRVHVPWRVRIYGDGDDRGRVLAFAADFPGRVDYRGHVPNRDIFPELDGGDFLFVHPCLWFEALGRGILEAMALEIPVVVPDVGGPAWSVRDGVTGLHYRHRDPADLARRIEWAVAHPDETRRLATRGREASVAYDYRTVARGWRDALERILEKSGPRG